jgi:CubicO group peptidase (beta-lactamase class C family)
MISRRDLLLAGAAGSVATWPGLALAQSQSQPRSKKTAKKKQARSPQAPIQADRRTNDVLAPVRDEYHLPGLIGAILVGSRLATIGALGIRKIGSSEPIRPTDQMHIGSCTKAMTATLIGMLVEARKLKWNSTIRDVFPTEADGLHPQFQTVTLSHLLTHRAGLPQQAQWWSLPGQTGTQMRYALLHQMLKDAPATKPGTTYAYSNVGYALAGLMAEQVTGESWESLLTRRLFEPLGMTSAGFGIPGQRGDVSQPWGHRFVGKDLKPIQIDNPTSMGPAGTVHCSVPDWAKFAALHLGHQSGSSAILKPSTLETLHTPPPGREYAGGWMVCERSWAGGIAFNHAGSNTTFYVTAWLAPVRNFAILVATNQGGKEAEEANDKAVQALLKAYEFLT